MSLSVQTVWKKIYKNLRDTASDNDPLCNIIYNFAEFFLEDDAITIDQCIRILNILTFDQKRQMVNTENPELIFRHLFEECKKSKYECFHNPTPENILKYLAIFNVGITHHQTYMMLKVLTKKQLQIINDTLCEEDFYWY